MNHTCDTCRKHCDPRPPSNYCGAYFPYTTNADRIRVMDDDELADFLGYHNPCNTCTFGIGWKCKPDRKDYSDSEKCKIGCARWLKLEAKE